MPNVDIPFDFAVVLISATDPNGDKVFHYVAIKVEELDKFAEIVKSGQPYDVQDYGIVVKSGYDEPNQELIEEMEKLYGCNHKSLLKIPTNAPSN